MKKLFIPLLLLCPLYYFSQVGIKTSTPQRTLHVNGSLQVTSEINVGGNASTAGSAGTSGQVLTSKGASAAPEWQNLTSVSGNISNTYYIQGTTAANINAGQTADVPGVTLTHTVPPGKTQTLMFNILGYALAFTNTSSQGVFSLLENGTKISSAYASKAGVFPVPLTNGGSSSTPANGALNNMPVPVTFIKAITLTEGTYIFKVQYAAWAGSATVNYNPSNFVGYNGDNEAMLTKMQVFVYNN
ncbi:hypothetical protein ACKW6Q_04750 [Chryseobacterium kwangjuense]|uniref:DUF4397 domain-containing protein n=1 Tax=Chryseobacterium kwangjuense TaxID=267125 RepID=A0ABW9K2G2_9FLAO